MNSPSDRFVFELAKPADSGELREILEQEEFKGKISLLYTRRPDVYASLQQEGEEVITLVCRDRKKGLIIGFGACAIREVYIDGRPEKTGYLFGLRSRKEYRRIFPLLPRGYAAMHTLLQERGVTLLLTSILEENTDARELLEKPRTFMPAYTPICSYTVYIIKRCRRERHPYQCRRAVEADAGRLVDFLNAEGSQHQGYPVLQAADLLQGKLPGLKSSDFLLLSDTDGQILAAGAVWDQREYKQYLTQGYGGWLKYLQPLSGIFPRFGYPALPAPGTVVNFATLSFWAVRNDDPELFRALLGEYSAAVRDYAFFVVGMPEANSLNAVLHRSPHLAYRSRIYQVDWEKSEGERLQLDRGLYLECGWL